MIDFRTFLSRSVPAILACALFSGVPFNHANSLPIPAAQTATVSTAGKTSRKRAAAAPAPSSSEIADAKAKGMVWANTESKVYHTGGKYYGATKHGRFMSLTDAEKAGYKASKR